ncbi:response regulator transcription factor [Bacteroidota bacterium]
MRKKILYIEDEPHLGKIVKETLDKRGYEVLWEMDGARVINKLNHFTPDLCLLDIMLPNIDGYTLCKQIRKSLPIVPVIFLTAKVETADLLKGFEAGGTDYIKKPFSIEELIARINNQFKLSGLDENKKTKDELPDEVTVGNYSIYTKRYELKSPEGIVKLSNRDMEVLGILLSNKNRITDRRELLLTVWGDDSYFNSRNLDVYIRKIRKLFKGDSRIEIQTLKGKGYLFIVPS